MSRTTIEIEFKTYLLLSCCVAMRVSSCFAKCRDGKKKRIKKDQPALLAGRESVHLLDPFLVGPLGDDVIHFTNVVRPAHRAVKTSSVEEDIERHAKDAHGTREQTSELTPR